MDRLRPAGSGACRRHLPPQPQIAAPDPSSVHVHHRNEPCPACATEWQRAVSVSELGELTARFIEGRLRAHPYCTGAIVDPETAGLVSDLAQMNRAGLITENSQPGLVEDQWLQRAWVSGWCPPQLAQSLAERCLAAGLAAVLLPPGQFEGHRVCITRDHSIEHTWAGGSVDPVALFAHSSARLARELTELWSVDLIDPVWGRSDLLWTTIGEILGGGAPS